jgi:hypothetical protein
MNKIIVFFLFLNYISADDIELYNGKKYEDVKYSRSNDQVTLELKNCIKAALKYTEIKIRNPTTPKWNCPTSNSEEKHKENSCANIQFKMPNAVGKTFNVCDDKDEFKRDYFLIASIPKNVILEKIKPIDQNPLSKCFVGIEKMDSTPVRYKVFLKNECCTYGSMEVQIKEIKFQQCIN